MCKFPHILSLRGPAIYINRASARVSPIRKSQRYRVTLDISEFTNVLYRSMGMSFVSKETALTFDFFVFPCLQGHFLLSAIFPLLFWRLEVLSSGQRGILSLFHICHLAVFTPVASFSE